MGIVFKISLVYTDKPVRMVIQKYHCLAKHFFFILEILKYKLRHLLPFLVICIFTLGHLPPCLRPVTPLPIWKLIEFTLFEC